MDYYALSELIVTTLLGLSVLAIALGFSFRVFLAPVVRDILGKRQSDSDREQQLLSVRLEQVEERLSGIETAVHRIAAVADFNKELRSGEGTEDVTGDVTGG